MKVRLRLRLRVREHGGLGAEHGAPQRGDLVRVRVRVA